MSQSTTEKSIIFKTNQESFKIPLRFFLYQSSAADPSKTPSLGGGTINLSEYDVKVVKIFVARILEPLQSCRYDISVIRELYELAQIFQLQRISQDIENQICSCDNNEISQYVILLNDKNFYSSKLGKELTKKIFANFETLSSTSILANLNGEILSTILDSCDLQASSEVKIFQVILQFLKKSRDRLLHVWSLLSCLRMARLNDAQRKEMMKELEGIPQAPQIGIIAGYVFNEENFYRCCVLKEHEKLPRCGKIAAEIHGMENTIFSNKIKLYNDLNKPEHQRESYSTATGSLVTTKKPMPRSSRVDRRLLRQIKERAAFEKNYRRYFPHSDFE